MEKPSETKNKLESQILISENDYIQKSVDYALSIGWVKESQKTQLIEKYLRPVYKHSLDIVCDVKKNGLEEGEEFDRVIRKLNWCLEATRRIGSTDPTNILRTIADYRRNVRSNEEEYAVDSFYEFVAKLLDS